MNNLILSTSLFYRKRNVKRLKSLHSKYDLDDRDDLYEQSQLSFRKDILLTRL